MTKMKWRDRILFIFGTAIVYSLMLFIIEQNFYEKPSSVNVIIFKGVLFGLLMGIGIPFFFGKLTGKFSNKTGMSITPELELDEKIEIEGFANLFRGFEAVGGKLFLTDKKMIFKSHKINIQNGQTDIQYQNVNQIIKRKTSRLINNGIRIVTNDNRKFDFVINDRDWWFEKISERIN